MANLEQFIFFDFEMLCSNRGMPYTDMESIRLGAVKYELKTGEIAFFDRYIKPKQIKPLSKFCKKLTGIEDKDLVDADSFKDVFEDFLYWVGGVKRSRFFSWSPSDLSRLKIDAFTHQISSSTVKKIEERYIDFQAIFTKRVSKTNHSVENALALYNLTFKGDKHNPMYDAYNTLRIYLSFATEHFQSDLIMLNQFIFANETIHSDNPSLINESVKHAFKKDITEFFTDINYVFKIKDAQKVIKKANRLVTKYENIVINRSGLFDREIINYIRAWIEFYKELLHCYEEHETHASRIMILDDHMIQPFQQLAV